MGSQPGIDTLSLNTLHYITFAFFLLTFYFNLQNPTPQASGQLPRGELGAGSEASSGQVPEASSGQAPKQVRDRLPQRGAACGQWMENSQRNL